MYVIGVSDWRLIKIIKMDALYDGKDMRSDVKSIEYDTSLSDQATIFPDIERAKEILEYIKNNAENIQFTNNNFVAQVLDEDNGFDKMSYAKELKLFELVPVLINDESKFSLDNV